ncbi:hypothetical protein LEQ_1947 [Ligilactobacillus equi DPC 6820]|uniref:ABC transmembrane type-1 domain-containing protein n=2 Tax=Ligilactobacillus equi TaxID=137357 RepID=V7I157_9LACO|nr:hypothetical protein LEQ_1947 [Ligilactobacillus equi DPC 6820]
MELFVPLVITAIINQGIGHHNSTYVWWCFALLLGMAFVGMTFSFTAQWFTAKASVGCVTSLHQALFDHIGRLSYSQLDKLGTDTLITRLTSDINQVQNGLNLTLRLLLRSPFIVFGAVVMAFFVNVKAAIIFVITIPILSAVVFGIMLISGLLTIPSQIAWLIRPLQILSPLNIPIKLIYGQQISLAEVGILLLVVTGIIFLALKLTNVIITRALKLGTIEVL